MTLVVATDGWLYLLLSGHTSPEIWNWVQGLEKEEEAETVDWWCIYHLFLRGYRSKRFHAFCNCCNFYFFRGPWVLYQVKVMWIISSANVEQGSSLFYDIGLQSSAKLDDGGTVRIVSRFVIQRKELRWILSGVNVAFNSTRLFVCYSNPVF